MKPEDVEWVVNDLGELGVKIQNQFFFMYKGHSLVYEDGGGPMRWRPIGKREFGECCHPYKMDGLTAEQYFAGPGFSDGWKELPTGDK